MLWIYQRGVEDLRIETSFDNATHEYLLVVFRGSDKTTSERFKDAAAFQLRLEALESDMANGNWRRLGDPIILPNGWKVD